METGMTNPIVFTRAPSPLGELTIATAGDALYGVWFAEQKYFPAIDASWEDNARAPILREAVAQLTAYFAGTLTRFDLPLAMRGTHFQQVVWTAISAVGFGTTTTYSALAEHTGNASSVRAAGAATGRNPWSIVIPCHRIVGGGGALTGYAGGLERKRALLAHEHKVAANLRQAA
jgi:methylated-DNA-[protein]-cysteine S-methyltransferase